MAKVELTLEELKERKIRRSNGWTRFWAIVLAFVLVAGVTGVAYKQADTKNAEIAEAQEQINQQSVAQSWGDDNASSSNNSSADNDANANAPASDEATEAAKAINAATAAAASKSYDWHRICEITKPIDVGDKTDALNNVIHRVDSNANLDSVVGGFIGRGDKQANYAAGADAKETFGNENYQLMATKLNASDLQDLKVEGNKYTFKLADASNPQKDGGTSLNRLTNDFITQTEVATGIKDALGVLSSLLSVKSADVAFTNIEVAVEIQDGNLVSMEYKYYMDVKKLELSIATGTGGGEVSATYNNFK